ncbi:putative phosphatase regulatory subunit-domain-containing protein [Pseudomassariella vexata]|uniref:Putative phosphatase regulatory subunit-domain-containing protein n=1 Tax=Pseudomassariella vexata TaxID=1141098 RepID=A0A1Y2DJ57_9PEZI|nr:putative phosphatase regulatory subunit-domain-containing protein [Pseudomassariella vexata]ORY59164.1 putative phosphatase regulatory subunit-domain-containing protein [Pseudomassariella vexata]
MPYTPPANRSPASSAPSSPSTSRRSSFHGTGMTAGGSSAGSPSRPALPRSASYLSKHRRAPSAVVGTGPITNGSTPDITPPGTSHDLQRMVASQNAGPIRQSPPPIGDARSMPPGAIISPPESQSSSEDEGATGDSRGRQIENLKELQDAISAIPQHRESSPNRRTPAIDVLVLPSQIPNIVEAAPRSLDGEVVEGILKSGSRKIAHSRASTEPFVSISMSKSAGASPTISDEDEDEDTDEPPRKPQMVRKKSGELVRPALRPSSSQRRPSSMPGTPTFSKAVHFDSHLEHVRHFLQVDRPLAVSAGSSPVENYESDTEYPFNTDDKTSARTPPFEWDIAVNNFPADTPIRKSLPARLDRVWMSSDQKSLVGSISVANLAFQKTVVCRFTFDYWKTTSEVAAEYSHEIRPRDTDIGHDQFQFNIKLSDLANLESKTLYFCIKYCVNGVEYWDNNNGVNFQVDFKKKALPQNGKKNFQGASSRPANSLPRSTRRTNPSAAARPMSMPVGIMDEFGHDSKFVNFEQPIHEYLGESRPTGLRLKSSKSTTSLPSDNLTNRLSAPSGLAFANRYDFGASLTAAMQAQKDPNGSPRGDGLYMKPNKKGSYIHPIQTSPPRPGPPGPTMAPAVVPQASNTHSPASATIASASYEEIVNKYCFFNGSKQSSPQIKDGTLQSGRYDGAGDEFSTRYSSANSSSNSSPEMPPKAQHHSLRYSIHNNLNPYFQNPHVTIGASPAESPIGSPSATSRQSLSPSSSMTPTARSGPPTPMPGSFSLAGTSIGGYTIDTPSFNHAQHHADRFPFTADAHTSPAIRG